MKTLIALNLCFMLIVSNRLFSYLLIDSVNVNNENKWLLSGSQVEIFTPFGHSSQSNTFTKNSSTWSEADIEHCKQNWMYSGGLYNSEGSCTFTKKSNYIPDHEVLCLDIASQKIYAGTVHGIYKSTDLGESWLSAINDDIDNLSEKQINALSVTSGTFFAATNEGIQVSNNFGETWVGDLSQDVITSITIGTNDDIYIGSLDAEVYKSTDGGLSWYSTTFSYPVYCLSYSSNTIFAGSSDGIWKKAYNDNSWISVGLGDYKITSILIDGSIIYAGTEKDGCWISTNCGEDFVEKNGYPYTLPKKSTIEYYQLNSIIEFDGYLYAATENGLYKSQLPDISSWTACAVHDNISADIEPECKTMMLLRDYDNSFWIACQGSYKYNGAILMDNLNVPLDPSHFPNYTCLTFAWHLSEGGQSRILLPGPMVMGYTNSQEDENWDYIEESDWKSDQWEKVTYGNASHSGIKGNMDIFPPKDDKGNDCEDCIRIISKWGQYGPIVEHYLKVHPFKDYSSDIKYWKCKKKVSGNILENQKIGRQITTDNATIIQENSNIEFKVAPMQNHFIHLSDGFHAERGSNFHAWVDETYAFYNPSTGKPTWENDLTYTKDKEGLDKISTSFSKKNVLNIAFDSFIMPNSSPVFVDLPEKISKAQKNDFIFSGKGSGTDEDPYQITNIEQFQEMKFDYFGDHYYILMNDIDAIETREWNVGDHDFNRDTPPVPMGFKSINDEFRGYINGKGHIITNLYINHPRDICLSLFRGLEGVKIKNLGLVDVDFTGVSPGGFCRCGDKGGFLIENCFITGKMTSTKGDYPSTGFSLLINGTAKNCYSECTMISDSLAANFTFLLSDKSQIVNCYAAGNSTSKYAISPFGYDGKTEATFWDNETIKVTDSIGIGIGLPTSAMMKRATFEAAGWDFDSTWYIDEGMDYPRLQVFRHDTTSVVNSRKSLAFNLHCNPNPAENIVNLDFSISKPCPVLISISNSLGMKIVEVMGQKYYSEGSYREAFDTSTLPSGVYFCTLQTPECTLTRQFLVVR